MKIILNVLATIVILFTVSCGTYYKQKIYRPHHGSNWNTDGANHLKYACNIGWLSVSPILLKTSEITNGVERNDKDVIFKPQDIEVLITYRSKPLSRCNTSDIWVKTSSSRKLYPGKVRQEEYRDYHFEYRTAECFYLFDAKELQDSFEMFFNPTMLNCNINPIQFIITDTIDFHPAFTP